MSLIAIGPNPISRHLSAFHFVPVLDGVSHTAPDCVSPKISFAQKSVSGLACVLACGLSITRRQKTGVHFNRFFLRG